jgi:hypothetical protein
MRFREKTQSSFLTFIAQGSMESVHMDQRSNPVMNNEGRNCRGMPFRYKRADMEGSDTQLKGEGNELLRKQADLVLGCSKSSPSASDKMSVSPV